MGRERLRCVLIAAAMTAAAPAVTAQESPRPRSPFSATLEFMGAEMPLGPVVRGAPFSGEGVTTTSQTLADGTRIERRVTARLYRDTEGRVRREQTVLGLGALNPSADAQPIITISDPVAGVTYVLDPNGRIARRSRMATPFGRERELEKIRELEKLRAAGQALPLPRARSGEPAPPLPPPPPPPGERPAVRPANVPNWPEPLGTRQMEGVTVTGTRRTETIPAGRIGNDRAIVITDERWESPELKMVVMSQHHDPRTGDVEYRLTNISRAEPPHDLFTVPADYDIVEVPPPPAPRQ